MDYELWGKNSVRWGICFLTWDLLSSFYFLFLFKKYCFRRNVFQNIWVFSKVWEISCAAAQVCVGHIASAAPETSCAFAQHHLDGNMGPQLQLKLCFCILAEATSALCNSADVEVSAVCMAMPVCQHDLCRSDYQSHSCYCKEVKLTIFNPNFLRIQSLFPQLLCHRKTFTEQTEKEENETWWCKFIASKCFIQNNFINGIRGETLFFCTGAWGLATI